MPTTPNRPLLRHLPALTRLGLSGLMLVLLMGMAASAAHLFFHYRNRDESKEFTLDDVRAAYHGLDKPSSLLTSLEQGHPTTLKKDERDLLIKWLNSGRIAEDYENIDLGADSPSGIIAASCLSCHSATSTDTKAAAIRLDSMDNIKKVAFSKKVNPNPVNIIAVSTHTHALALGTLSLAVFALIWLTRLPRTLVSVLFAINGLALFGDIAAWWLARNTESFVYLIAGAGGIYNATTTLMIVLVLTDLWWPRSRATDRHRLHNVPLTQ